MTETDVVDYLLYKDKFIENTYNLYQNILYYLQHRNYENFDRIINYKYQEISKEMISALNTLRKY